MLTVLPYNNSTTKCFKQLSAMSHLQIGFLIYPDVTQLDVMGAYQVLAFPHNTQVHFILELAF
jgi:hypothetical protein